MIARVLAAPLHAAALATGAKSFRDNPLIGSPRLNALGLHEARIGLAERMADARRARLARLVAPEDARALAEHGIVVKPDFLPPETFAALTEALAARAWPMREMRQGGAVTRLCEIGPRLRRETPGLDATLGPVLQGLLRYAAATDAEPLAYLHCVFSDADVSRADPQTHLHSDTFHATAKGWLFLADVAPEDGPFAYVPGSHRLTPGRIAWERAQSLAARDHPDAMHALGSLRAAEADVRAMGYGPVVPFPVRANTLVIADTHGFHARARAARPSVRPAIYASLRRNPFLPWTGLDLFSLPGLAGRKTALYGAWQDFAERRLGLRSGQPAVGLRRLAEPPGRASVQAE